MKFKHVLLVVFVIIILDQLLKIYIKTNYYVGKETLLFGLKWARLTFIENEGMAFGLSLGGSLGKLALTLFRLVACVFGFWFLHKLTKKKHHPGLIFCASLVLAGALGNLIDSTIYGKIFSVSPYHGNAIAHFTKWGEGYGSLFHGKVVDMFYFPIIEGTWPTWVPGIGGNSFIFFRPIFNLADAAISCGVIAILLFQGKFIKS